MSDDDSELLGRCRRGDEAAWAELVARHTRRVFALAYRFTGRVDEAEDLTQDVFVKVFQALDRYEPTAGSFGAWLMAVARNRAIDNYRRRREDRLQVDDAGPVLDQLTAPGEAPDGAVLREERARLVRRALTGLPRDLREALILCDLEGLAYDEIATTLGVPLGTVKSRINRARLELARRLQGRRQELAP